MKLVLLVTDRASYGNLSQLITRGRRKAVKGSYAVCRDDVAAFADGLLALWVPPPKVESDSTFGRSHPRSNASDEKSSLTLPSTARWVAATFPGRAWLAVELFARAGDRARLARCAALAREASLPQVAAGDVHMHVRARRALQDTVTAIRVKKPLAECGYALHPNGERHLRSRARLATIYPPELLAETVAIARALHVLARRIALRVSGGNRAGRRDAGLASAQAHRGRIGAPVSGPGSTATSAS